MSYFKTVRDRFKKGELRYSYVPVILVFVFNIFVFYATRLVNASMDHYDISIPLDGMIPFIPGFISVYVLAYVQWLICFIAVLADSKEVCCYVSASELTAKFVSMLFFILLPTVMVRPDFEVTGLSTAVVRFIYTVDAPDNLFPSLHCLESWCCFRSLLMLKHKFKHHGLICAVNFVFTLLVFVSVVAVDQHLCLDIVGGVAVTEIGFGATSLFKTDRLIEKLSDRVNKKLFGKKEKEEKDGGK